MMMICVCELVHNQSGYYTQQCGTSTHTIGTRMWFRREKLIFLIIHFIRTFIKFKLFTESPARAGSHHLRLFSTEFFSPIKWKQNAIDKLQPISPHWEGFYIFSSNKNTMLGESGGGTTHTILYFLLLVIIFVHTSEFQWMNTRHKESCNKNSFNFWSKNTQQYFSIWLLPDKINYEFFLTVVGSMSVHFLFNFTSINTNCTSSGTYFSLSLFIITFQTLFHTHHSTSFI